MKPVTFPVLFANANTMAHQPYMIARGSVWTNAVINWNDG